eukprot:11831587-Prorocentrum_lima.AAC.1
MQAGLMHVDRDDGGSLATPGEVLSLTAVAARLHHVLGHGTHAIRFARALAPGTKLASTVQSMYSGCHQCQSTAPKRARRHVKHPPLERGHLLSHSSHSMLGTSLRG